MDKGKEVSIIIKKVKNIANNSLQIGNLEKAMAAISVGCQILYEYNQKYTDIQFEEAVQKIANIYRNNNVNRLYDYHSEKNTILFYDGFGLDTRGVAKMYLYALYKNKYKIIYITRKESEGKLQDTLAVLEKADKEIYFVDARSSYKIWVDGLLDIFFKTKPKAMFFYTTPYDVSGAVGFSVMEGKTDRFLIDLTDHAFWLGTKSNDYFCGSREMSASNQVYERGINREKIIKLGVNLFIDDTENNHDALPFDVTSKKYIFSGGALYKTLGDTNNYYYKMVDHFLAKHIDLFFIYAGYGDKTEMNKLIEKYPERCFLIPERKDFYFIMKHCTIYLNTYPMFGGMMMKYAANAGKLPITLKHENDSDGLLIEQETRRIEYNTYEELIEDVDRLLTDEDYLRDREMLLEGSIISEDRFVRNVYSAIENHTTDYKHGNQRLDTTKFKKEYYERFEIDKVKTDVSKYINRSLFTTFVWMPFRLIRKKFRL